MEITQEQIESMFSKIEALLEGPVTWFLDTGHGFGDIHTMYSSYAEGIYIALTALAQTREEKEKVKQMVEDVEDRRAFLRGLHEKYEKNLLEKNAEPVANPGKH